MKHPRLFALFSILLFSTLSTAFGKKLRVTLCVGYEEDISMNTYPAGENIKVFVVTDEPANEDFETVKTKGKYEAQGQTQKPGILILYLEPGKYIAYMEGRGFQVSPQKFIVSEHDNSLPDLNDFQKRLKKHKKIIEIFSHPDSLNGLTYLKIELDNYTKTILDDITLDYLRQALIDYQPGRPNPQFDQFMNQLFEKNPEVIKDPRFQNIVGGFIEENPLINKNFLKPWGLDIKELNRY